jgi:glycine/serine hydroxymethyltransferase
MKENEMRIIANIFTEAIKNHNDLEKLNELKNKILELCKSFPIYKK